MTNNFQTPLFLTEIKAICKENKVKTLIDATYGEGGHGLNLAKQGFNVLGIEFDPAMYKLAQARIKEELSKIQISLVNDNYRNIEKIVEQNNLDKVDAVIFDLGLSMRQLIESKRGFSFKSDELLDLRINPDLISLTGEKILNSFSKDQLNEIFTKYMEDLNSQAFVNMVIGFRLRNKITTVQDLALICTKLVNDDYKKRDMLLRKILQALRVFINDENESLKKALIALEKIIKTNGVVMIITFHSLEDRLVKLFFRKNKQFIELLKKPFFQNEFAFAKSAKLRVYRKIHV